ncbi:hypothetical protein HHI36_008104 [Cryptolaemus montrouzieri]|uniref:Uncharacterized protein n=1 Tax=Cryptolaemus montrouzieri TaxID=559131 RepID=A0ABD2MRJ7_9CUCU
MTYGSSTQQEQIYVLVTWNTNIQSGHGKGTSDSVGGVLKRTADRLVASGIDINKLHILLDELWKSCPNVSLFCIFSEDIAKWDIILKSLSAFSGTMKIHQLTWCYTEKDLIIA